MTKDKNFLCVSTSSLWYEQNLENFDRHSLSTFFAEDITQAEIFITTKNIHIILIDLILHEQLTINFIKKINLQYPSVKVLLFVENNEVLSSSGIDDNDFKKIGITSYFLGKIEIKNFFDIIENENSKNPLDINNEKTDEKNLADYQYEKFYLSEEIIGVSILFDIYIKLGENRFLKILNQDSIITEDFVDKYFNEKKLNFLYYLKKDRMFYINFCNQLFLKLNTNKKLPIKYRVKLFSDSVSKILEEVNDSGLNKDVTSYAKNVCENINTVIYGEENLSELLKCMDGLDPEEKLHAFYVVFISGMIGMQYDWDISFVTETLSFAAFFHDIGKSKLREDIQQKRSISMSAEEYQEYKKHSELGSAIISEQEGINPTVAKIIFQHHEANDGSGFPQKLDGNRILTLSKIVFFADIVSRMMIDKKISSVDAVNLLLADQKTIKKICPDILYKFSSVCLSS